MTDVIMGTVPLSDGNPDLHCAYCVALLPLHLLNFELANCETLFGSYRYRLSGCGGLDPAARISVWGSRAKVATWSTCIGWGGCCQSFCEARPCKKYLGASCAGLNWWQACWTLTIFVSPSLCILHPRAIRSPRKGQIETLWYSAWPFCTSWSVCGGFCLWWRTAAWFALEWTDFPRQAVQFARLGFCLFGWLLLCHFEQSRSHSGPLLPWFDRRLFLVGCLEFEITLGRWLARSS